MVSLSRTTGRLAPTYYFYYYRGAVSMKSPRKRITDPQVFARATNAYKDMQEMPEAIEYLLRGVTSPNLLTDKDLAREYAKVANNLRLAIYELEDLNEECYRLEAGIEDGMV
jgi:hypothetical protein